MAKSQIISQKQTTSAANAVQGELYSIGLWYEDSRLLDVEVYWCPIPSIKMYDAAGFFFHGTRFYDRFFGYEEGHIYVPSFLLIDIVYSRTFSLRDIIRHEYAHALAHYYPEMIVRPKEFKNVFGGTYYSVKPSKMEDEAYITEYAKTDPSEDFAETFMVYVRRKGVIPTNMTNPKLKRKWKYISKIIKLVK